MSKNFNVQMKVCTFFGICSNFLLKSRQNILYLGSQNISLTLMPTCILIINEVCLIGFCNIKLNIGCKSIQKEKCPYSHSLIQNQIMMRTNTVDTKNSTFHSLLNQYNGKLYDHDCILKVINLINVSLYGI